MTVEQLLEKHKGFVLLNKAYVKLGDRQILVGRMGADGFEMTEEGAALAGAGVEIVLPKPTTRSQRKPVQSTDA